MKQMTIRKRRRETTFYCHEPSVNDRESAVQWIERIAALKTSEPKYIALRNSPHKDGKTGENVELPPTITAQELLAKLDEFPCERICLVGKFEEVQVVLSVNMENYEIAITVPIEDMHLIGAIMEQLDKQE